MEWWIAAVDRLYPVWLAGVVLVLGGLTQAIAVAAGWAQALMTRRLLIAGTFLVTVATAWAQLRYTARSQQPTSHRRPWNIPSPVDSFTGRREELAQLRAQLRRRPADGTVPTVVLAGIPGVGKTRLARAYAHRSRRQYRLGWWLTAETATTLDRDLRALARRLDLDYDSPPDTLAQEVHQALAGRRRWLLVFDNADQAAQIAQWLPREGRGQILITSRHGRWQQLAETLTVTPLPTDDAVMVLLAQTRRHEPDAARKLVEALDHLPLAIEQAAAYISSQPDPSIARYLELFRTHEQQLLDRGTPPYYQEGRTVAGVVAIAMQQLGKTTAAGQLLCLCTFLAPDQLPLWLLLSRPAVLPAPLADVTADEVRRRDAEQVLYRLGLLTNDTQDTAQLHRLLQDAVRLHLSDDEQCTWAQHAIVLLVELLEVEEASAKAERWPLLIPHIGAALDHALLRGLMFDGLARLLEMTGQYLRDRQQLPAARNRLEQALAMFRRLYGDKDRPDIAAGLTSLGNILRELGELVAARDQLEQALAMSRRLYGDRDHPNLAISLTSLGNIQRDLGELEAARDRYEQALAMYRRVYGDGDHPNIAASLTNLGNTLRELRNHRAAATLEAEAEAMNQRLFEQRYPIPPGLKDL